MRRRLKTLEVIPHYYKQKCTRNKRSDLEEEQRRRERSDLGFRVNKGHFDPSEDLSLKSISKTVSWLLLGFLVFVPNFNILNAQKSLALTVTPPLFQLTIGPGEFWASNLKVVNTNSYDIELYATVMDFKAQGENGGSEFIPLIEEYDDPEKRTYSLASWIDVSKEPILVPSGESKEIPFFIKVPQNAEPGGHYAAILVGTQPGYQVGSGPVINVSSFVSSLLFVRIDGEVIENGRIREFSSEKTWYKTPEANFFLRFENIGNVHVQPQGDITIYNMWGKERGKLLVNQKSYFGNVLPKSVRKFEFSWKGENNVFEIGRYSAIATLAYGSDGRKNISVKTYFWIVPVVPMAIGLSSFGLFVLLMLWFVRRYIKRALLLERELLSLQKQEMAEDLDGNYTLETFTKPLKEGVIDLRNINVDKNKLESVLRESSADFDGAESIKNGSVARPLTFSQFIKKYRLFFLFLLVAILGVIGFLFYFNEVLITERDFKVEVKQVDM